LREQWHMDRFYGVPSESEGKRKRLALAKRLSLERRPRRTKRERFVEGTRSKV